jgi:hypothetical protein
MAGKAKGPLKELPKLDEWKAPWEVDDDGNDIADEDQEIDPAKLKKYLYNLQSDKLKLQTKVDEATTRAEELEEKVANAADPAKLTELQQEVARVRQERDDAAAKAQKDGEADLIALKYEVALDLGLTKVQARRLMGTTKEELEQDAEELLASFGGGKNAQTGDDEDNGGDTVRRGPRRVFQTGTDSNKKDVEDEIDPDKWAAEVYAARRGR